MSGRLVAAITITTQIGLEAVHFDQHLVQRLLAFVVAAAQAGAAVAADGVDLVDEDDAGRTLLGLLEHVAHAGRADADKHLDKVRAADAEERHLGLAGNGLGQQGLAGAGRADEQHTAGDPATELLELLRVFEEIDQFLDLFLRFVAAGDVGEGGRVVGLVQHARLALAEAEGAALATALHLAHEVDPDTDQQQHRTPADQDAHQQRGLFAGLDVELDAVVDQVAHQTAVEICGRAAQALVVGGGGDDLGAAARIFLQHHRLDALAAHLFEEV